MAVTSGNVIATAFVRIQPESTGFGQALRQTVATNLLQLEKQGNGFLNKIENSLKTTAKLFATTGVTSLSLFSAAAIKSATDLEKTSNAFKGLFGGVEEGRKQFDKVFELAEKTPFEGSALSKDFQKFVASYTSSGLTAQQASDKSLKILQTLADSGSALGATTDQVSGFALALTQTIGKGKLTGEEIRQMTNNLAGFNVRGAVATKLFGNSLPESVSKLDKEMKKGLVSADVAVEGILEGLYKIPGALGASERQLRTVSGSLSTIKDIFERATFDGLEASLKVVSNTLVDNSEVFRGIFKQMSEELGGIIVTLTGLGSNVLADFDKTFGKIAVGGMKAFGAAIYGVSEGLNSSFQNFGRLGDMLQRNQGYFVILGRSLGNLSEGFSNLFTDIVIGFEPVLQSFTVLFEYFTKGAKFAMNTFGDSLQTGLLITGSEILEFVSKLQSSFEKIFKLDSSKEFIANLARVGQSIIQLLVSPLDALDGKTDSLARAFNTIFEKSNPALKNLSGAIDGLGDSFGNVIEALDFNSIGDLIGKISENLIEGITTITTFGTIFINIFSGLLSVIQPLVGSVDDLTAKLAAAFLIFKVTNSPILAIISLFKDFDTGLLVFLVTLTKVVPMLRQFQTALAALGATEATKNIASIGFGFKSLVSNIKGFGSVAPMTMKQFIGVLTQVGELSPKVGANLNKALELNNLSNLPARSKLAQGQVTALFSSFAAGARELPKIQAGFNQVGTSINGVFNNANSTIKTMDTSTRALSQNLGTFFNQVKGANITTPLQSGATAANNLNSNTAKAGTTAATLGTTLGGIGGIVGSIGLGVGISLLTSHLAKSAEQANKTKQSIQEATEAAFKFFQAGTGTEREEAISGSVEIIQGKFADDNKALGQFTEALAASNISYNAYVRDIYSTEKERNKTNAQVLSNLLAMQNKDVIEYTRKGKRNVSSEINEQGINFYTTAAEMGLLPEVGRAIDSGEIYKVLAKRSGTDLDTIEKFQKASQKERESALKKAGLDKIITSTGGYQEIQLTGEMDKVVKVMREFESGAINAAERNKKLANSTADLTEKAAIARKEYGAFVEAQRTALSSTSAFYDKVFEFNNPENINKLKSNLAEVRKLGIGSDQLIQSESGRNFLSAFTSLTESEDAIKTNINAPIAQQIGLLKQSNEEFKNLGERIGLNADEMAQLNIEVGNFTLSEDLADFAQNLFDEGKLEAGGANLKALISEVMQLSESDRQLFLDSLPKDSEIRKRIEKGMEDLEGSVILKLSPEALSDLQKAIDSIGKDLFTSELVNGFGLRAEMARSALKPFIELQKTAVAEQVNLVKSGQNDIETFNKNVLQSRKDIIKTLEDAGIKGKEVKKIYSDLFLSSETLEIKTLVDGLTLEEKKVQLKGYFEDLSKEGYPVLLKAKFEIDPELAVEDFIKKAEGANKSNNKYAFGGISSDLLANIAKDQSGEFIRVNVIPEIDPKARAEFIQSFYSLNPEVGVSIISTLDEDTLKSVLDLIPDEEEVKLFTSMDAEQLAETMQNVPDDKLLTIFSEMDQAKLNEAIGLIPPDEAIKLISKLDEPSKNAVMQNIRMSNPELYAKLVLEETEKQSIFSKISSIFSGGISVPLKMFPSGGGMRRFADGDIVSGATYGVYGEAGPEALIPLSSSKSLRAMELTKKSGLYDRVLRDAGVSGAGKYSDNRVSVEVNMSNTRTTDPEALGMFVGSQILGQVKR